MATTHAPPVSHGEFNLISTDFYVTIDDVPYLRASSIAIAFNLSCLSSVVTMTKDGPPIEKQLMPYPDPPANWYIAQCLHYGLGHADDKEQAKRKLMIATAKGKGRLTVPLTVFNIERELLLEWTVAETVFERRAIYENLLENKKSTLDVLDKEELSMGIEIKPAVSTSKKALKTARHESIDSSAEIIARQEVEAAKQWQGKGKLEIGGRTISEASVLYSKVSSSRGRQTARKSIVYPEASPITIHKNLSLPETSLPADASGSSAKSNEHKVNRKRSPTEASAKAKKSKSSNNDYDPTGRYSVSCHTATDNWEVSASDMSLLLVVDESDEILWARYNFGMFYGIMKFNTLPFLDDDVISNQSTLNFKWRGREDGESVMSFGDGCEGSLTFNGIETRSITGWISVYGHMTFTGEKRPGPFNGIKMLNDFKTEWNSYNQSNYDYENQARWGTSTGW